MTTSSWQRNVVKSNSKLPNLSLSARVQPAAGTQFHRPTEHRAGLLPAHRAPIRPHGAERLGHRAAGDRSQQIRGGGRGGAVEAGVVGAVEAGVELGVAVQWRRAWWCSYFIQNKKQVKNQHQSCVWDEYRTCLLLSSFNW